MESASELWWTKLPVELITEIVDYNRDDLSTLRSLCLASRKHRAAAVRHLFVEIQLSLQSDFDQWREMTERNPQLQGIVQIVHYKRHWRSRNNELSVYPFTIDPLPNVHTVFCYRNPLKPQLLQLFPNISQLTLDSYRFKTWLDLARRIGVCGHSLTVLELHDIQVGRSGTQARKLPKYIQCDLSAIQTLRLGQNEAGSSVHYLDRFIRDSGISGLRSMVLAGGNIRPCSTEALDRLFGASRHTLEDLTMNPSIYSIKDILTPRSYPKLRSLSLWIINFYSDISAYIRQIQLAMPSLTSIAFLVVDIHRAMQSNSQWFILMPEDWKFLATNFPNCSQLTLDLRLKERPDQSQRASIKRFICSQVPDIPEPLALQLVWSNKSGKVYSDIDDGRLDYANEPEVVDIAVT
ncbi:hypothetical protein C8J56DRAFT_196544 [Mycena floridula]|nr:hypothetical protein C8J56DRAFT_196544 [Mycena floridula]